MGLFKRAHTIKLKSDEAAIVFGKKGTDGDNDLIEISLVIPKQEDEHTEIPNQVALASAIALSLRLNPEWASMFVDALGGMMEEYNAKNPED